MKKVINGNELYQVMTEAIDLICDAVASTLGPSGNNVIINTDDNTPYITNDGVTIANAIESDDKVINTILEIVKEASLKTNELVGDGTTTTLVLLKAIFKNGLEEIKSGIDPIILKKELNSCCNTVLNKLDSLKSKPTTSDLIAIGTTSCGDESLSILINEVYKKMHSRFAIKLEESKNENTYYEIKKGYSLDVDISNLYFQDKKEIVVQNTYVLLIRGYLDSLEQIGSIINEGLVNNKNIIILAEEYNESINNEVILYYLKHKKNIFIFKMPDFSSRKNSIYEDIRIITGAIIKDIDYEKISFTDLGKVNTLTIKKDEIILYNDNQDIEKYISMLHEELNCCDDDYNREFIENRLAKLENGLATIYVGAPTKTEMKEKMLRVEDALYSINIASLGVVSGEGLALLGISDEIENKIIKKALEEPIIKIIENSGLDYKPIVDEIRKSHYKKIYNIETDTYEDLKISKVLDSVEVVKMAFKNSLSIASMLLTTKYLVINENQKRDAQEDLLGNY